MCVWSTAAISLYLAGWTALVIQREGVLDVAGLAVCANCEIQLIIVGDVLQQAPGPLETQLSVFMQQQVCLEGAADPMTKFAIGSRPARANGVIGIDV